MSADRFDNGFRVGDAITIVVKVKPFIDVSIPPSANEYRKVSCVNLSIYGPDDDDTLVHEGVMLEVPNRPGWYFYRYQTTTDMQPGGYTVISVATCRIDGQFFTNRNVQQIVITDDGI